MDFVDSTLADFAENDLKELWDSDYYAEALRAASELDWSGVLESPGGGGTSSGGNVVLNDRLMTEASLGVISQLSNLGSLGTLSSLGNLSTLLAQHQQEGVAAAITTTGGPIVKTEHSYSIDTERPASTATVTTDTTDIESECFPAIPISEAEGTSSSSSSSTTSTISTLDSATSSDEDEDSSSNSSFIITTSTSNTSSLSSSLASSLASLARKVSSSSTSAGLDSIPTFTTNGIKSEFHQTSSVINVPSIKTSIGLARPAAVVVTQRSGPPSRGSGTSSTRTIHTTTPSPSRTSTTSGLTLRLSSASSSPTSSETGFSMPPTPPSCSGSDSEYGGSSPTRTTPLYEHLTPQFCNPRKSCTRITVSSRNPINTPLISTQPKGVTGPVNLTEEEKRTLVSEGYTIPSRLPLTKTEEKSLKKIRRKIKNKISAQESRRKKKEYMDALERKVESISQENLEYKRRLEALQTSNSQLLVELHRLQTAVAQDEKHRRRSTAIATTTS